MNARSKAFAAALLSAVVAAPAAARTPSAPTPAPAGLPLEPVIIDPGHGGHDLGAVAHGLREKDIALAVARRLRARLQADVPVMMTRDSDRFVTLDRRLLDSVDWSGALFVSIHLNEVRNPRTRGATVYSYGPDLSKHKPYRKPRHRYVPPMPAPPRVESSEGAVLARDVALSLRRAGVRVERRRSDYYVLKNPGTPSVLVELGYLSNAREARRLADPAYQDRLAGALARAIESYDQTRALRAGVASSW
ncbi:MAG: N-acetylmuramoyl-L-alanine amidase [Elusimicrobia bacterium]|nr:N-acetylmuramoyl-L-alanine amidase [Elusimicrobiota bacterium]